VARTAVLRKVLAEVIKESELPRTLIARDASLGRATLESWLSGTRSPSPESAGQIASALEMRAAHLTSLAARLRQSLRSAK
jgi:DNA-binding phage protein